MDCVIYNTENLILSPSNRAKLKARNAALKLRNGSPKLKEVLRHRCRERIKEKRGALFNTGRHFADSDDEILKNEPELSYIVRQVVQEMDGIFDDDSGFNSQTSSEEAGYVYANQIKDSKDQEDFLMDEIDKIISEDEVFFETILESQVICPICQKGSLSVMRQSLLLALCNVCGEHIPVPKGLEDLERCVTLAVQNHCENCHKTPYFTKIADGTQNLYIICIDCSYYQAIF